MSKSGEPFQLCQVPHQCFFARIFAVDTIVPTTQRHKVIPHVSMAIYRFLQFTIPVIAIYFELVGFHGIVCLSYPVQGVWKAPPGGGVNLSHERQNKYTRFHLQIQPFFTQHTGIGGLHSHPKGWGIARKIR